MDDVSILIFAALAITLILIGATLAKQATQRRLRSGAETSRTTLERDLSDGSMYKFRWQASGSAKPWATPESSAVATSVSSSFSTGQIVYTEHAHADLAWKIRT